MAPQRRVAEAAILGSSKRHSLSRISADPISPRGPGWLTLWRRS